MMGHMFGTYKNILAVLFLTAGFGLIAFAATYHLTESPAIWYDEGFYTQLAMNLAEGKGQTLQIAPEEFISAAGVTAGFPFIAPVALSYKFFGVGVFEGRAVMVIFILGFAAASYFLIRRLFGTGHSIAALFLLGSYPVLYGNGKSVLGEVPGLLYLALTLLALLSLERNGFRGLWRYALPGALAGLTVVTKPIFVLLIPAFALALLFSRRWKSLSITGTAIGFGAFLLPCAVWVLTQFGPGDSLSTLLSFYANPYEVAPGGIAALVVSNILRFVKELSPLYTGFFFLIWLVSLLWRWRAKKDISVVEQAAFWFSTLVLIAYLRTPGWYRYFFPATITALLFAPQAATVIFEAVTARLPSLKRFRFLLHFALVLLVLSQCYQLGFSSYVASYYGSGRAAEAGAALQALPKDSKILLYNVPELAILLPGRNYYQFLKPHPEQLIGEEGLSKLAAAEPDLVLVTDATYKAEPNVFYQYRAREAAGRYTILERL
jgi:hypothetical protein